MLGDDGKIRYFAVHMAIRLFEVLFLGFLCGLIPGPVLTAIFMETVRGGWRKARRIVLTAASGEAVMSVTCVLAASFLNPRSFLFSALSLFGALLLFSIAWDLWRTHEIKEEDPLFTRRRIFFIAFLNGMAWIFWITVCVPQAIQLRAEILFGDWLFILLFELGWLSSTFSLSLLVDQFRPYFQANKKLSLLYRTVAIFFFLFGLKLAIRSAHSLLK